VLRFSFQVSSHIFTTKTFETVFLFVSTRFSSLSTANNLDKPILPHTPGKLFFVKLLAKFSYLPPELTEPIFLAPLIKVSYTVQV
jgi:hypothetical protein